MIDYRQKTGKSTKVISLMNFKEADFLRYVGPEVEQSGRTAKPLTRVGFKRYAKENTYKYENLLVEARFNE